MSRYFESWAGCSWGTSPPETAQTVAKAFFAGKKRKRGNCRTDGRTYYLFGVPIARRIPEADYIDVITHALETGQLPPPKLQFSWNGWPTRTTSRHLRALGVNASVQGLKNPRIFFDGKRLPPDKESAWWSLEEIANMQSYEEPPPPPRPRTLPREEFVNFTLDLFDDEQGER